MNKPTTQILQTLGMLNSCGTGFGRSPSLMLFWWDKSRWQCATCDLVLLIFSEEIRGARLATISHFTLSFSFFSFLFSFFSYSSALCLAMLLVNRPFATVQSFNFFFSAYLFFFHFNSYLFVATVVVLFGMCFFPSQLHCAIFYQF